MKNSTVFNKAAKLIMERGLCKEGYGELGGPVCLFGAYNEVVLGRPDDFNSPGNAYTSEVLQRLAGESGVWPPEWSDKRSTTADEVVQLLQFMALAEKDAGR